MRSYQGSNCSKASLLAAIGVRRIVRVALLDRQRARLAIDGGAWTRRPSAPTPAATMASATLSEPATLLRKYLPGFCILSPTSEWAAKWMTAST